MKSAPFHAAFFGDKRLARRANLVLKMMVQKSSAVINQCFTKLTDKISAYRMLNNENVTTEKLEANLRETCAEACKEANVYHVLCAQDTCEINYEAHCKRLKKFGDTIGHVSNNQAGCFFHAALAFNAATHMPLGFIGMKFWNRKEGALGCKERKYKKLPIEEKESYRWCEVIETCKEVVPKNVLTTVLSDRESDIFSLLSLGDDHVKILIRAKQNRCLKGNAKLRKTMEKLPVKYTYQLEVPRSHGRKARTAKMQLRFAEVEILPPSNSGLTEPVKLNCIMVSEVEVPEGVKPIDWILLTNHEVTNVEEAMQCVQWYKCRWFIEELFRLMKKQGFHVEDIQLEKVENIEKNLALAAYAAMQVILLKHAYNKPEDCGKVKASLYYYEDDIATADIIMSEYDDCTDKLKNPFPRGSLAWFAWIIARLGSWCGYRSQSPPGYITFYRGLERFNNMSRFYSMMKDKYKG